MMTITDRVIEYLKTVDSARPIQIMEALGDLDRMAVQNALGRAYSNGRIHKEGRANYSISKGAERKYKTCAEIIIEQLEKNRLSGVTTQMLLDAGVGLGSVSSAIKRLREMGLNIETVRCHTRDSRYYLR